MYLVDIKGVLPGLRDLPRAVVLLARALVRGERHEALSAVRLVPGLAVQLSLRWLLGEVLVMPGRAVLSFSKLDQRRGAGSTLRKAVGFGCAVVVGVVLFGCNQVLLALPVGLLILLRGGDADEMVLTLVGLSAVRLLWTGGRALAAYRVEHRRGREMVRCCGTPRWRVELMGATPPRRGYGLTLITALTHASDAAGATVYLVCEPSNHSFYRRAGFRTVVATDPVLDGLLLMRRIAPVRSHRQTTHR